MPSWGLRAQLIQLAPSAPPRTQARSRRAGLPQRACIAFRRRQGPSRTAPRPRIAAATFPSIPTAAKMRDPSPQSPQQEQRYLRDVFRERGDLLGDGWAAAPLPAPRAVPPSPSPPDSPARVPPPLEGAERDTRQPEDTTAPRKSAAALRATLADGWAAPALSSKRRDAPHRAASTPEPPSALDTITATVASLFTSPASDSSRGQSYDQYMQTHESPKRAPLMDYETTASTEERGPVLGRDGYDPGQRVVPALDACGCAFEMFSPAKKPGVRE